MSTTQDYLPIKDIHDDVLILKDGSMSLVLETTAVNFGLLSDQEQLAIISAFAALLNSLSFSIQIVIRSKRLDITSYLKLLSEAETLQKNPLLAKLMEDYRRFIETIVRENQVLDKKFYIIISISPFETGLTGSQKDHFQKALTILLPRRDHIIRQLWRTGLKASQLTTRQLINLYYDIYNPPLREESLVVQQTPPAQVQTPLQRATPEQPQPPAALVTPPPQIFPPEPIQQIQPTKALGEPQVRNLSISTPFVVEELPDEYGTA